jgi:hypothetical protein
VLVNTTFENKVEQLYDVTARLASALEGAGIPYQVVGGLGLRGMSILQWTAHA